MPEHLEAGEPRQQRRALGAKAGEILPAFGAASALNRSNAERNPRHFSAATPA